MTIESITAVGGEASTFFTVSADTQNKADISKWITSHLQELDGQIQTADHQVKQLATGQSDNLHQIMTSLEKAKLSFELTLQVRNKLLEGYQEIMRMQI